MRKHFLLALVTMTMLATGARALENDDLLALVAMPLAVAAVSEVTDVPMSDLMDVVTLLNDAAVPPQQFIEVVRYVPVALVVETDRPRFVEFVRQREQEGLRGTRLVTAIEDEYRYYGLSGVDLDVTGSRIIEIDRDFIPPPVRTRLVEWRKAHPHGGPPGQVKKQLGLQTGAEVVHGTAGNRDRDEDSGRDRVGKEQKSEGHRGSGNDKGDSKGKGKGNGKGKGHGKGGKG